MQSCLLLKLAGRHHNTTDIDKQVIRANIERYNRTAEANIL
jgi:hypothetical protein